MLRSSRCCELTAAATVADRAQPLNPMEVLANRRLNIDNRAAQSDYTQQHNNGRRSSESARLISVGMQAVVRLARRRDQDAGLTKA